MSTRLHQTVALEMTSLSKKVDIYYSFAVVITNVPKTPDLGGAAQKQAMCKTSQIKLKITHKVGHQISSQLVMAFAVTTSRLTSRGH